MAREIDLSTDEEEALASQIPEDTKPTKSQADRIVELVEDATFDETALRSHCREHLAPFKVPREIRVVAQLPRNPTGKIMRRGLTAETPALTTG